MEPIYGEQTRLTLEHMSFSGVRLYDFPAYIQAGLELKHACAVANQKVGQLSAEKEAAISAACRALSKPEYLEQFPVDVFHGGGGIGINMNLNEVIAGYCDPALAIHPVDDVNLNQSTADICHTALHIALIRMLRELIPAVQAFRDTVEQKEKDFSGVMTVARTCWQDGMRVSASAEMTGLKGVLDSFLSILKEASLDLCEVNIGGTVIGSGTGASKAYRRAITGVLRNITGLTLVQTERPYEVAQYPETLTRLSSDIYGLASVLSKFAKDIRIMSSGPETGLMEWTIPAIQAGSSFFPGKVNPVIPEMMIQCELLISSNHFVIQQALSMGEMHLNIWEEMMGFLLMKNLQRLTRAVTLFRQNCLDGLKLNEEVCERDADAGIPLLVAFKEKYGYERLSAMVKKEGLTQVIRQLKQERNADEQ